MSRPLIRQAPSVLVQELGDELVFLNIETEYYFHLDAIGKRMWEVLQTVDSIDAGVDILLTEFDTDFALLRHDVEQLLAQLQEAKLIL